METNSNGNNSNGLRSCPTRVDGSAALFAHKVSVVQCQDRQRGRYHKCFTCAYNNAYVVLHGTPELPKAPKVPARVQPAIEEQPVEAPQAAAPVEEAVPVEVA